MRNETDSNVLMDSTDINKPGNTVLQRPIRTDKVNSGTRILPANEKREATSTSDDSVLPLYDKTNGNRDIKNSLDESSPIWFVFLIICSVGMVILNKSMSVGFPHPNTILGFQNSASAFYLWTGSKLGFFTIIPFKWKHFKPFIWVTINWVFMLALSLKMLQYNSVATMVTFRAFGTVMTCIIEQTFFNTRYSRNAKFAMAAIFLGSLIYANSDQGFSFVGYMWASMQIASWVLQVFIEKIAIVDSEQTKTGVTVIRNILSLPVTILMIIGSGENNAFAELFLMKDIRIYVALSSFLGCGLGVCTSALYKSFAPTTVAVANNVGKCVSIVLGCFLFNDTLTLTQITGLALSFTGSFWYGEEERKRLKK